MGRRSGQKRNTARVTSGPRDHDRKFGFYFKCSGEPLDGCEERTWTDLCF